MERDMKELSILIAVAGVLLLSPRIAAAALPDSLSYALNTPPSSLESGCQGPCDCAVVSEPTYGSFDLVRTGADASYTYYQIHRYIASFNNGPGAVSLIGSGTYRIDSSAGLQEMTLDLDVWGQPEHFDSGVVPVSVAFPQIHAACAVHGFACFDSVVVVGAQPAEPVAVPSLPQRFGLQAAWPDPFTRGTSIRLDLGQAGAADLQIVDASGRTVRVLAAGQMFDAGPRAVQWDGRTDRGVAAPPGVYWAVLRWAGGIDRRRLVKLD
jgi:flagellar hook capping protein FlgD